MTEPLQPGASRPTQRGETAPNLPWFPWPDKQTCILDILWHLPRSLFSDAQLQVILWGLTVLGIDHIPSIRNLKDLDSALQTKYGVPSLCYQGSLGHVYYVNHLPSIIAQEMGNPRVRPHIHHYPEDTGGRLDQPWQAARWLHEIDPAPRQQTHSLQSLPDTSSTSARGSGVPPDLSQTYGDDDILGEDF
ncbi:hypothetical protein M404DRAFT_817873 [Pisolithus tinctorius Marx 270]|uniref:Uncharacterized protein n=1 Tax=Pisolithus tinctorius Marx 270 TaxID=870435 RepID=A0A0C3NDI9_PISTI|nr:hypothetical protein M404DRAFT_817873 [Pisolithus tinctorius Marx 270]